MHNWNQLQPAPYDGMYQFPSVDRRWIRRRVSPSATNCTICSADDRTICVRPDSTICTHGLPMLPTGKYVVEVVLPPGYELVKEEDKNILIGDNFIAPVTQQFGGLRQHLHHARPGLGGRSQCTPARLQRQQRPESHPEPGDVSEERIVPGFIPEPVWPCVGEARIVPDYISLFPQSKQVAPFAGATRNLCDRKEVTLSDQMGAIAKFYIYTSTHIASKFTGGITDDFTSEFDPFSPQFGEKFAPPNLPVSVKDWAGNEISPRVCRPLGRLRRHDLLHLGSQPAQPDRLLADDDGRLHERPGTDSRPRDGTMITDPLFNPATASSATNCRSCRARPQYLDTPVVPTSAFAGAGYNNPTAPTRRYAGGQRSGRRRQSDRG